MSDRAARRGLLIILLVYLLAGTVYSIVVPLGEPPDEMEQFQFMRYIVEERRLPRTAEDRFIGGIKSEEPPLYYALMGIATSWVDISHVSRVKMLDPEKYPRNSLPDEVLINFAMVHTADEEWPFRGLVLVWHLARLLSLCVMATTLVVLFKVVRLIFPKEPGVALLATTVAALTPQFLYTGASLQNDALTALLGTLLIWLLIRLDQGDLRWRQFVLVGFVLGLTRLTKFYTLAMLPEVVLVLLALAWRERQPRYLTGLGVALLLSFAIPLPWLLYIQPIDPAFAQGWGRILRLFDIVHVERWFGARGVGQVGTGVGALWRALAGIPYLRSELWLLNLFKSLWAYFGAMTVQAPREVYAVAAFLTGLSLLGWLCTFGRRLRQEGTLLSGGRSLWIPMLQLLAFLVTEAIFFGTMKRLQDTSQARHLYPALAGLALLLAIGWWGLWRPLSPTSSRATAGLALLLVGLSAYCLPVARGIDARPFLAVRSTPWPDAPAGAQAVALGDGLVLEGAHWSVGAPGRVVGTLFWRADQPPQAEAVIVLELLDEAGAVQAVWAGHPGGPRYPTQAWDAGDHVRQTLSWPLPGLADAEPQLRLRLLREGEEAASLRLPFIELPAAAAPAPGPAWAHDDAKAATAQLRDTLLLTWPGGQIEGLAGPDGALWQPLARTTRGDQAAYVVDARLRPGIYTLPGEELSITVEARERAFAPPAGIEPVGALLGDGVELLGYSLGDGDGSLRVAPGEAVRLRLAWRARGRIERHYTVFTHLVDGQGRLVGQHDKLPGQAYSTLFWAPGEVVVDEYSLQVDGAAPAGSYHIEVGLYQALTGERAAVQGGGDHLVLGQVEVLQ